MQDDQAGRCQTCEEQTNDLGFVIQLTPRPLRIVCHIVAERIADLLQSDFHVEFGVTLRALLGIGGVNFGQFVETALAFFLLAGGVLSFIAFQNVIALITDLQSEDAVFLFGELNDLTFQVADLIHMVLV